MDKNLTNISFPKIVNNLFLNNKNNNNNNNNNANNINYNNKIGLCN